MAAIISNIGGSEKVKIDGQKVTEKMELQSINSNFLGLDPLTSTEINDAPFNSYIHIIDNTSFLALSVSLQVLKYYKNGKPIATFTMPEEFTNTSGRYRIFEDNQKNIYYGYRYTYSDNYAFSLYKIILNNNSISWENILYKVSGPDNSYCICNNALYFSKYYVPSSTDKFYLNLYKIDLETLETKKIYEKHAGYGTSTDTSQIVSNSSQVFWFPQNGSNKITTSNQIVLIETNNNDNIITYNSSSNISSRILESLYTEKNTNNLICHYYNSDTNNKADIQNYLVEFNTSNNTYSLLLLSATDTPTTVGAASYSTVIHKINGAPFFCIPNGNNGDAIGFDYYEPLSYYFEEEQTWNSYSSINTTIFKNFFDGLSLSYGDLRIIKIVPISDNIIRLYGKLGESSNYGYFKVDLSLLPTLKASTYFYTK